MLKKADKEIARKIRHKRVRAKVSGTGERPRLSVFRSSKHIYAQIVDDLAGKTLVAASTLEKELADKLDSTSDSAAAKAVGELLGQKALAKGIQKVVFDRGGYVYHGRVAALAEGAREAGLEF
jgi:large subunit ribosomal protein L18